MPRDRLMTPFTVDLVPAKDVSNRAVVITQIVTTVVTILAMVALAFAGWLLQRLI